MNDTMPTIDTAPTNGTLVTFPTVLERLTESLATIAQLDDVGDAVAELAAFNAGRRPVHVALALVGELTGVFFTDVERAGCGLMAEAVRAGRVYRWRVTIRELLASRSFYRALPDEIRPVPRPHFNRSDWDTIAQALLTLSQLLRPAVPRG